MNIFKSVGKGSLHESHMQLKRKPLSVTETNQVRTIFTGISQ